MKDIDTSDTRVGTACTFTGKGSLDRKGRRHLALLLPGVAMTSLCVAGAAYFILQSPPRQGVPAPTGAAGAAGPTPRASVPAPDLRPRTAATPDIVRPSGLAPSRNSQAAPALGPGTHGVAASSAGPSVTPVRAPAEGPSVSHAISRNEPARPPSAPASPRFHVQAGSFEDRDNAVSLAAQLRAHGYAVAITDGPLYRVWVGAYLDRGTAEHLASNLRNEGFDATLTLR